MGTNAGLSLGMLVQMGHVTADVCRQRRVHSPLVHCQGQTEHLWRTPLLGSHQPQDERQSEANWSVPAALVSPTDNELLVCMCYLLFA